MKGILFTPEMALAACSGIKTVTRRVITGPAWLNGEQAKESGIVKPYETQDGWWFSAIWKGVRCDYSPGEKRCLLTTWAVYRELDHLKPTELPPSVNRPGAVWHAGCVHQPSKPESAGKSRPGRFLPNTLRPLMPVFEIVSVRAERVHGITEADAQAEGAHRKIWITSPFSAGAMGATAERGNFRDGFKDLWDSINAARGYGWDANPWVWRVEFRRVEP